MAKRPLPPNGMIPSWALFALEYLIDKNATQAAIRAGFSAKTAAVKGCELLKKPAIAKYISAVLEDQYEKKIIEADEVLLEIRRILMADIGEAFDPNTGNLKPLNEIPDDVRRAISSVKIKKGGLVEVKFWSKTTAAELAGKHLKLFTEKLELTAAPDFTINLKS